MHSHSNPLERTLLAVLVCNTPLETRYTHAMDSVRFGRALGSAAKALGRAVDAAASPNPSPVKPSPTPHKPIAAPPSASVVPPRPVISSPITEAARSAARATVQARRTGKDVARGGRRFGEAVWSPIVKLSGVLWLEITGAFFGIFALFAGQATWTHRVDLYAASADRDDRIRAFVFLAMALAFGYFCLSSFYRARRRERSR